MGVLVRRVYKNIKKKDQFLFHAILLSGDIKLREDGEKDGNRCYAIK